MIIVEDEALVCLTIQMFAEELGWQIAGTASSESAALELLGQVAPALAVIDINLGSGTSFRAVSACRERGVPVLFVTDLAADKAPEECGDDPVLGKPFSLDDFDRALRRCVGGEADAAYPEGVEGRSG